jgi:hypothetical protein
VVGLVVAVPVQPSVVGLVVAVPVPPPVAVMPVNAGIEK